MNNLPKNWWASKTIWASVLATVWPILMFLSKQFNFDLPAADTVAGALGDIGTVVLSAIAVYGRVTASAPIAKPSTPGGTASVIVAMVAFGILTGCTSAQIAADQAKIQAAVAANAANITKICGDVMTVADDPLTNLAALTVPIVAQMQASSRGVCLTAEGIAAAAKSATTIPWLSTASTVMASQGAVLPPPVAPVPVSGS